jgi:S1-C subfamily serine protease
VFTTRSGVRIPATLGGVHVQTIVTGMIVARSATIRYDRPVPIGVSAGLADFATGTLGARVSNGSTVYALSNNHVVAGVNEASIGDPILQPGPIEDGGTDPADRIGRSPTTRNRLRRHNISTPPSHLTPPATSVPRLCRWLRLASSTTVSATVGQGVQK